MRTKLVSAANSIYKIPLKNLVRLGYKTDPNHQKSLLIGAVVGLSVGAISLLFVGDSHSEPSVRQIITWELIFGTVGGVIGGLTPSNKKEYVTVDFSKLNLEQSRKKLNNIFKLYLNEEQRFIIIYFRVFNFRDILFTARMGSAGKRSKRYFA